MNRLQKKCFIGASGMHLLLLVILFVGPAFLSADKVDDSPVLTIVPDMTTDRDAQGGGPAPRPIIQPAPTPAAPVQPLQQPVQPPRPEPKPPVEKPAEKVVPRQVEPVKDPRPDPNALATDKKQPHKVAISDTVVKIKDRKPTTSTADKRAEAQAAADRRKFVAAANAIRSGLSQTTTIETAPGGFGGGGPSYANYAQTVRKIYNDAWNAWSVPDDVTDDEATVQVSVTIARDGRVTSSRIVRSSGSRAVVNAAQAVLDRVTSVRPFPAESKDTERTFTMTFKLNAKKLG
jgi:periplasmic protein TonB